jgi:inner membrane transporter RhtA
MLPFGLAVGGTQLFRPEALLIGAAVGLLSSAIPYTFELEALRRIRAPVFGVLMSLEPGIAALAGFLVLGQTLGPRALLGILLVTLASLGASRQMVDTPMAA